MLYTRLDTIYAVSGFFGWVEAAPPTSTISTFGTLACWQQGCSGLSLIGHVARTTLFEGHPDKSEVA